MFVMFAVVTVEVILAKAVYDMQDDVTVLYSEGKKQWGYLESLNKTISKCG